MDVCGLGRNVGTARWADTVPGALTHIYFSFQPSFKTRRRRRPSPAFRPGTTAPGRCDTALMRRSAQFRNGSLTRIASVDWLLRTVLQYGAEAEVLGPPVYREAVKWAVGAVDDRKSSICNSHPHPPTLLGVAALDSLDPEVL